MFGLDDILIGAAIGGGLGGLTNRKNPLQGALIGAGLGGLGGGLSPSLGLAGSTAPGSVAAEAVGQMPQMASGTAAAFGPQITSPVPSAFGLLNAPPVGSSMGIGGGLPPVEAAKMGLLDTAMGVVKPVGQALGTAMQAKQAFGDKPQPIQPSPMAPTMPNNNLGTMVQGMQQQQQQQMQLEQQKRMMRRQRGF